MLIAVRACIGGRREFAANKWREEYSGECAVSASGEECRGALHRRFAQLLSLVRSRVTFNFRLILLLRRLGSVKKRNSGSSGCFNVYCAVLAPATIA